MSRGISLELGGKSPLIVFEDADIGAAVDWIITGFLWGSGQVCYLVILSEFFKIRSSCHYFKLELIGKGWNVTWIIEYVKCLFISDRIIEYLAFELYYEWIMYNYCSSLHLSSVISTQVHILLKSYIHYIEWFYFSPHFICEIYFNK